MNQPVKLQIVILSQAKIKVTARPPPKKSCQKRKKSLTRFLGDFFRGRLISHESARKAPNSHIEPGKNKNGQIIS
jgi:hypothetical protein